MQTAEAAISLLFLVFMISSALLASQAAHPLNDSLYRYQLANDAWRVLYLKGSFQGFGDDSKAAMEADAEAMKVETGLCIFVDGIRYANCRGGHEQHEIIASVKKAAMVDNQSRQLTFSIAR